ncbi:MAG: FecR domain-containing protein [Candidatus Micropelagos thuwalensis]
MFRPSLQSVSLHNLFVIFILCVFTSHVLANDDKAKMIGVAAFKSGEVSISRDQAQFMPASIGEQIFLEDKIQTSADGRLQILLKDETTFTLGPNAELIVDKFIYDPDVSDVEVSIKSGAFRFISGATAASGPDAVKLKLPKATLSIRGTEVLGDVSPTSTQIILMSGIINVITDNDVKQISQHGWGVEVNEKGEISEPSPVTDIALENVIVLLESKEDDEDEEDTQDQVVTNSQASNEEESDKETQEEDYNENSETTPTSNTTNNESDSETGDETTNTAQNDVTDTETSPTETETDPQPVVASNTDAPLDVNGNLDGDGQLKREDDETSDFDKIILTSFQQNDTSEVNPLNTDDVTENNLQTENNTLELTPDGQIKQPSDKPEDASPGTDEQSNIINQLTSPIKTEDETEKLATEKTSEEDMKLVGEVVATNPASNPDNTPQNNTPQNITPQNNAPVAEALADINIEDTSSDDTFPNISAKINANDPDGDNLTFAIANGTNDTTQTGFDLSLASTYGTLYLNSTTGDLLYVPNDGAIEGLTANASEEFDLNISDGTNQISQTLKAFIIGTDDSITSSNAAASIEDTTSISAGGISVVDGNFNASDLDSDTFEFSIIVDGSVVTQASSPEQLYGPLPAPNDPNYEFIRNIYDNYDKAYDLGNSAYGTDIVLNSETGAFKLLPNGVLLDTLDDGETAIEEVSFQVTNGAETLTRLLNINYLGAEDPPEISSFDGNPMSLTNSQIDAVVARVEDRDVETFVDLTNNLPSWIGFAQDPANPGIYIWKIDENANNDPIVDNYLNGSIQINFQAKSGDDSTDILTQTLIFTCQEPKCDEFIQSTDATTPVPTNSSLADLLDNSGGKISVSGDLFNTLNTARLNNLFDASSSSIGLFKRKYSVSQAGAYDGDWDVGHVVMADYGTKNVQSDVYLSFNDLQYVNNASGEFTNIAVFDWNADRTNNQGTFSRTQIAVDTGINSPNGNDFDVDVTHHVSFLRNGSNLNALAGAIEIKPSAMNESGYDDNSVVLINPTVVVLEPQ